VKFGFLGEQIGDQSMSDWMFTTVPDSFLSTRRTMILADWIGIGRIVV